MAQIPLNFVPQPLPPATKAGQHWTDEDEKEIIKLVAQGVNIVDIGTKMGRSASSINSRLLKIAVDLYNKNTPMDDIVKITSMSLNSILVEIEKFKNKQTSKKVDLDDIMEVLKKIQSDLNGIKEYLKLQ